MNTKTSHGKFLALGLLTAFCGLVFAVAQAPTAAAAPSGITLEESNDVLHFEWDESDPTNVDFVTIEYHNGLTFVEFPGSPIEDTGIFEVARTFTRNAVTSPAFIRVTVTYNDTSTASTMALTSIPPYYNQSEQFVAGAPTEVISHDELAGFNLDFWPDGLLGFFSKDGNNKMIASNGEEVGVVTTTDGLSIDSVEGTNVPIDDMIEPADFASGGPLYHDTENDRLFMIYHGEEYTGGDAGNYWSFLGLAVSEDGGASFTDLGRFIEPNMTEDSVNRSGAVEIGSGPIVVRDGYIYVYFKDTIDSGDSGGEAIKWAVARAPLDEVLATADGDPMPNWQKYYDGSFSEDGLGGLSDDLFENYPHVRSGDIIYSTQLEKYIMVYSTNIAVWNQVIVTSEDGINWSEPELLYEEEENELIYTTLFSGDFSNPKVITGNEFTMYRTNATEGDSDRWNDLKLEALTVTFDTPTPETDADGDGILTSLEDDGPNDGDTNDDGTADSEQSHVATFISEITGEYVTLEVDEECSIVDVEMVGEHSHATHDVHYVYDNGFMSFALECESAGYTTAVSQYYHDVDFDTFTLRKYNSSLDTYDEIEDAVMDHVQNDVFHYAKATYEITDGGELDEDGEVNSAIVDPTGLGEAVGSQTSDGSLADTGTNASVVSVVAITSSLLGVRLLRAAGRQKRGA